jgi:hypothetical protein
MKTNEEILKAAAQIFRQCVSATWNANYGEDDGSANILLGRLLKAVEWAKANNEENALKVIIGNVMPKGFEMAKIGMEISETIFA